MIALLSASLLAKSALMLLITLVAAFFCLFLLKHFKKFVPRYPSEIEIIGGVNVGSKSKVIIIKAYDTKILIGVSDSHIETLHVFDKSNHHEIVSGLGNT